MGLFEVFDGIVTFVGTVAALPAMAVSDAITSRAMEDYDEDQEDELIEKWDQEEF
ncbi:MAG: hypothetical protein Q4C91_13650 [Eubacteriales bacterium]|nr:hypothetical protein [Eubacteriales bacterium]